MKLASFAITLLVTCQLGTGAEQPIDQAPQRMEVGVLFKEIPATSTRPRIWAYLPDPVPPKPVPTIFIAPAGSGFIFGARLVSEDRAEHLPYVRAGFAVIAYELTGPPINSKVPLHNQVESVKASMEAKFGLSDLSAAIDFSSSIKAVDQGRLIAAGHSSSATMALRAACFEPRVAYCVAYAPATNIGKQVGFLGVEMLNLKIPPVANIIHDQSPIYAVDKLKCPLFLFAADDDSVIPIASLRQYHEKLKALNSKVNFVTVKHGDHYDSMIKEGIPLAIQWLKQQ